MNRKNYNQMKSSHLGYIFVLCYAVAVAAAMYYLSFEVALPEPKQHTLFVEFVEPTPKPTPPPPAVKRSEAPRHEHLAQVDNSRQVSGEQEQTRTVNSRALFKMDKSGVDEPENAGNPYAKEAEQDEAKGTGGGLNPVGTDALDAGLQGRGLVGSLPEPVFPPGNQGGKVVVRVTVDKSGAVTAATYEPKGSTTSASALVEAAVSAARKARFTESRAYIQGGTITYVFKLK